MSDSGLSTPTQLSVLTYFTTACLLLVFLLWRSTTWLQAFLTNHLMTIRHVDGHRLPGAPIRLKSYFHEDNFYGQEYAKLYGKVYHLWHGFRPVIILADVDAIRSFYRDHFAHMREPDSLLGKNFEDTMGCSLATAHGRQRVREYRGYFEPYFTALNVKSLLHQIGPAVDDWMVSLPMGRSVELMKSNMIDIPIKILTSVCYGETVCKKHLPKMLEFVGYFEKAMTDTNSFLDKLNLSYLYHDLPRTKPVAAVSTFNRLWAEFHQDLLQERDCQRNSQEEGLFFNLYDQIKAGLINLTEEELLQTVCEIWLLNLDITAVLASFLLYDLAKHPSVQVRVQEEVDSALGGKDPATLDDLQRDLPYLHMVMKESARMNPALAVTFSEKTVKDVTDMAGYQVPKGTYVCIDPIAVNYDPTSWPKPKTFDPERFAPGKSYTPYSFFRFGLGPRKCLGYRLGLPIIAIIAVKVLQKYELSLADHNSQFRIKTEGLIIFAPYVAPPVVFKERTTDKFNQSFC